MDYTRKMLNEIRKRQDEQNKVELPEQKSIVENNNLYNRFNVLMEEVELGLKKKPLTEGEDENQPKKAAFVIKKSDVQFGSVRGSQEDAVRKTVGDVKFKDDALKFYPDIHDLVMNAEVSGLGITFQFRYKDPSGDGCYIWADGLQLTDSNLRIVEKIRDAFLNWKQSLVDDGDLLDKLNKEANKD